MSQRGAYLAETERPRVDTGSDPPPDSGPEKDIAVAVITQALRDMAHLHAVRTAGRKIHNFVRRETLEGAELFLFAESGKHKQSRDYWAAMAGLNPEALSDRLCQWRARGFTGMDLSFEFAHSMS